MLKGINSISNGRVNRTVAQWLRFSTSDWKVLGINPRNAGKINGPVRYLDWMLHNLNVVLDETPARLIL